jgi:hypothetical protein
LKLKKTSEQIQSSNDRILPTEGHPFRVWSFEFVSKFGFRASCFALVAPLLAGALLFGALRSKLTFPFLMIVFSLTDTGSPKEQPIVTISAG